MHSIGLVLAGCIHLVIAIILIVKRPRDIVVRSFSFFNLLAATVLFNDYLIFVSETANQAMRYVISYELSIDFVFPVLTWFVFVFVRPEAKTRFHAHAVYGILALGAAKFAFDRSPLTIQEALPLHGGFFIRAVPSQYYLALLYVLCIAVSVYVLAQAYKETVGYRRQQYRVLFLGLGIAILCFFTYFAAPNGIDILPIGYIGSIFAAVCVSYAIFRYQLMDIEVVIKKGIAYSVATASIAVAYVGLILLGERVIQNTVFGATMIWPFAIGAVVVSAVAFEPLRSFVQNVVDRAFFKTRYDYQEAIQGYSKMVVTILDLDDLLHRTVTTITDMLRIHQAVIFLRNNDTGNYEIAAFAGSDERDLKGWTYESDSPLVKHLEAENRVVEDIDERAKGSVFVSLRVHRSLVGFLMLGEKLSGDVYTVTDLQLLKTLADQLGIAVVNARLYKSAVTDKLTKAFTGNYFYERLDEELARSATHSTVLSLIFFDVDNFTEFSKQRGAAVSDKALALIGQTIKESIQVYDVFARIGDDEFALILPGMDREGAAFLAGTIKKKVYELTIDGESGILRVCSGASYTTEGQKTARLLMNDARTRLLKCKQLKTKKQERFA